MPTSTPRNTLLMLFLQAVNSIELPNASPSFSPEFQNLSQRTPSFFRVIQFFRGNQFWRYSQSLPTSLWAAQASSQLNTWQLPQKQNSHYRGTEVEHLIFNVFLLYLIDVIRLGKTNQSTSQPKLPKNPKKMCGRSPQMLPVKEKCGEDPRDTLKTMKSSIVWPSS